MLFDVKFCSVKGSLLVKSKELWEMMLSVKKECGIFTSWQRGRER